MGLTGAERLTQDITELDQYYFSTDQRKLQLTKTISLAQLYPVDFQQLRETGVMNFSTPLSLFDQDFPGHYVRLIQQVSTSVIALIPPGQGIKATLSSTGTSQVVTGPDVFQTVVVRTDPQSVAITTPVNATGVFSTDPAVRAAAAVPGARRRGSVGIQHAPGGQPVRLQHPRRRADHHQLHGPGRSRIPGPGHPVAGRPGQPGTAVQLRQ